MQVTHLFFPPVPPEDMTIKTAIENLNTQRIARVAKAVFFTLSSIVLTAALALTEAAIITAPIAIPLVVISVITGLIFYRMNSLDERYVEGLTDKKRESLSKQELERVFLSETRSTNAELTKSLNHVNRLLRLEIFDEKAIKIILRLNDEAALEPISLGAFAFGKNQALNISCASEWLEHGQFGLSNYGFDVEVNWNGNPENPIQVKYLRKEKTAEGNDLPEAVLS